MLKVKLYTIYDRVGEEAGPITFARNDALARRMFDSVMEKEPFRKDFALFYIGDYDTSSMEITPCSPKMVKSEDITNEQA